MLAVAAPVRAGLVFVSSYAELGGNDSVEWGQFGPPGTTLQPPVSATSAGGLSVGVDAFLINLEGLFSFDPGIVVTGSQQQNVYALLTGYSDGGSPFTPPYRVAVGYVLTFDQPLSGAGADFVFHSALGSPGLLRVDVYSTDGAALGMQGFAVSGGEALTGVEIFVGFRSDAADIGSAVIQFIESSASPRHDDLLFMNRLDLVTSQAPNPVPAPSGLVLLAAGLVSLVSWARSRLVNVAAGGEGKGKTTRTQG
jgi:hypothetical protein